MPQIRVNVPTELGIFLLKLISGKPGPHRFRTKSSQNYKTGFSELRKEVIKRILGVVDGRLWV